jgi:hypothetical protein
LGKFYITYKDEALNRKNAKTTLSVFTVALTLCLMIVAFEFSRLDNSMNTLSKTIDAINARDIQSKKKSVQLESSIKLRKTPLFRNFVTITDSNLKVLADQKLSRPNQQTLFLWNLNYEVNIKLSPGVDSLNVVSGGTKALKNTDFVGLQIPGSSFSSPVAVRNNRIMINGSITDINGHKLFEIVDNKVFCYAEAIGCKISIDKDAFVIADRSGNYVFWLMADRDLIDYAGYWVDPGEQNLYVFCEQGYSKLPINSSFEQKQSILDSCSLTKNSRINYLLYVDSLAKSVRPKGA